jgi:hypothetical protein
MRFQFTSDADGDGFAYELDDGFYIDNVKVVKTTFTPTVLGVKVMQFSGKLLPDNTVRLDWEAVTDAAHDYFEIERSADGLHFTALGRSSQQPPYKFLDAAPLMGANHYRLRQVDKDGKVTYSHTVLIELAHQLELQVYPNPVSALLQLHLRSTKTESLRLEIGDGAGRVIYRNQINARAASTMNIHVRGWATSVYVLKLYAADGTLVSTQKVVKI